MKLSIRPTTAKFTHINTRLEKHGDDEVLGCDIDVEMEAPAEEILPQLCNADWEILAAGLWVDDDEGRVRELALGPLSFTNKFDDHLFAFRRDLIKEITEKPVPAKICKFKVSPENGHVLNVKFQVQLTPSSKQHAAYCDGLLEECVQIRIEPPLYPTEQEGMDLTDPA